MKRNCVAYHRVSTARQGRSGLGLEAQKDSVDCYLNGEARELVGEFIEVESGRRRNRPELNKALQECKRLNATLVIAKLDRLARNVHFITGLMESGVDFVAADMPTANKLTVQILAAVAEDEAERISARTSAALKAAKARGVILGKNGKSLAAKNKRDANGFALKMLPIINRLRGEGFTTVRGLQHELNKQKIPSAKGGNWHLGTVQRLLSRIDNL